MTGPATRLSYMEIFLLFCAKIGLGTTYLIMTQTGVGAGATSILLKRLEGNGLLTSSPGPRRQVFFSLTEKGEMLLLNALERKPINWVSPAFGIYDGLPRVIFFSWLRGRLDDARAVVNLAEARLGRRVEDANREIERCREILKPAKDTDSAKQEYASPEYLAATYKLIMNVASSADARLKVEALGALRQLIDELPPTPKTFLQGPLGQAADSTGDSASAVPQEK